MSAVWPPAHERLGLIFERPFVPPSLSSETMSAWWVQRRSRRARPIWFETILRFPRHDLRPKFRATSSPDGRTALPLLHSPLDADDRQSFRVLRYLPLFLRLVPDLAQNNQSGKRKRIRACRTWLRVELERYRPRRFTLCVGIWLHSVRESRKLFGDLQSGGLMGPANLGVHGISNVPFHDSARGSHC